MEGLLRTQWAARNLICLDEVDSTNREAMRLAEKGAPHGTLVVAEGQKYGSGRRGRRWESPTGENLYMSLILRPDCPAVKAPMLTLVMAYSVAQTLIACVDVDVQIKWPNDLILNKKKVCGILTEMCMDGQKISHVVIGVGINVNATHFPEELRKTATSLRLETGACVSREEILAYLMYKFEENYKTFCEAKDLSPFVENYNRILVNCGKEVRILEPGNEYNAKAQGINHLGELQVEKEDGTKEHIFSGEVSVRGIYGYV